MEFDFKKELQKIYEEELVGRQTNAGRIYRKFILRDEEFIRLLKKKFCKCKNMSKESDSAYRRIQIEMNNQCEHHMIDKLAGNSK